MTVLTVAGTRFKSDIVRTLDGDVERLTANIKGHFVQVNRHEQNDKYCTIMIDGKMNGMRELDDVEYYIKIELGII